MTSREQPAATESIALRAFAMLECIIAAPAPMSLDELTSSLRLPKPTVFRIVNLLRDAGLLRRSPEGKRYTAGPRLMAFAVDLWRSDMLRSQWHGALEEAVAETGESCNLTLLENDQVLYLDRVETTHPLRLHLEIGTRVPLHCTASGKLFLAEMDEAEARRLLGPEPYERFTAKTITTFAALRPELTRIRRTGLGTHDCERFDDSVAIAVPVGSRGGRAIALHAPSSRASLKTCAAYVDVLRRAAAAIEATMVAEPAAGDRAGGQATRVNGRPARRTSENGRP